MARFKLANVLLEDSAQFYQAPLLYVNAPAALVPGEDGAWTLSGAGTYDFTTFFNACSVAKWREYTVAQDFHLHLELSGAAATVTPTHAHKLDYRPRADAEHARAVGASENWTELDLELPVADDDILVGFTLAAEGPVRIRASYYYTEVDEACIRDVELALATTTFRKEAYITRNIGLVRERILGSTERIAEHFRMFVVDNGRTLNAEELTGGKVTVYPNDNVGGSGGFAYGMLLAQRAGDVTHVLLMDDDVSVSPESIIRTYNLLCLLRDPYTEGFVSGAMMNLEDPDLRWEDVGVMTAAGVYEPAKYPERMSSLRTALINETFLDTGKIPGGERPGSTHQMYAAWWYCCIPVSVIRREGMPLPFFVRFDDAEYGMRCSPMLMTMNGICIWHEAFQPRYNAGVERYQTTRNGLIGQAITGVAPHTNFLAEIDRNMRLELMKFNYTDAELLLEGFEDFLRGPDFFSLRGMAERKFMDANRNKEQKVPYAELRLRVLAECGIDLADYNAPQIEGDYPPDVPPFSRLEGMKVRQLLRRTLNGAVGKSFRPAHGEVAVIDAKGWSFPYGKILGVSTIVAVDVAAQTGAIRHRDDERCRAVWKRYQEDLRRYKAERTRLEQSYRAARPRLTSVAFWEEYLGV